MHPIAVPKKENLDHRSIILAFFLVGVMGGDFSHFSDNFLDERNDLPYVIDTRSTNASSA